MAGNNENNSNEITHVDSFDESVVMYNIEVHATPNVSQDNKIKINVTDETNITENSGVQLNPTSTKCHKLDNDMMSVLSLIHI